MSFSGRLARIAGPVASVTTGLLALAVILLLVTGADVRIPDKVFTALTPIFVLMIGWWLKQGQKETQRQLSEDVPAKIEEDRIAGAEARAFARGGAATMQALTENLPIPYLEASAATMRIVRVNERLLRLSGYEREEILGENVQALVPEHARATHADDMRRYLHDPSVRPIGAYRAVHLRKKDGGLVPVEIMLGMFPGLSEMTVIALIWPSRTAA